MNAECQENHGQRSYCMDCVGEYLAAKDKEISALRAEVAELTRRNNEHLEDRKRVYLEGEAKVEALAIELSAAMKWITWAIKCMEQAGENTSLLKEGKQLISTPNAQVEGVY